MFKLFIKFSKMALSFYVEKDYHSSELFQEEMVYYSELLHELARGRPVFMQINPDFPNLTRINTFEDFSRADIAVAHPIIKLILSRLN